MYNKKILIISLLFIPVILTACDKQVPTIEDEYLTEQRSEPVSETSGVSSEYPVSSVEVVAEKLEVYYFHRTARCTSCQAIGKFVRETMADKYQVEIDKGLIDFRELNVDLAENKVLAQKYQATGSSLFINRIITGKDNIEQDLEVWQLVRNEAAFKQHLESKINTYLNI